MVLLLLVVMMMMMMFSYITTIILKVLCVLTQLCTPNPPRIAHHCLHFMHKELSHHEVQVHTAKKLSSSNLRVENLNK